MNPEIEITDVTVSRVILNSEYKYHVIVRCVMFSDDNWTWKGFATRMVDNWQSAVNFVAGLPGSVNAWTEEPEL